MPFDLPSVKKILSSKYTAIAIIFIVSICVYLNTLPNEFVYDDETQVLENQWIRDVRYIPEIFLTNVWAFHDKEIISNYYRPLMHIVYMIDYYIFGLKPWGFHLTNIILNAGISVLVFIIISILINQSRDLNSKVQSPNLKSKVQNPKSQILNLKSQILSPAFITAILFAAHPIHTEAVAWIAGVPELLFSLFYLLSFYFYIKTDRKFTPHYHSSARFILSVLFFSIATLCKEPALTLPILLFVYDYSFRKDTLLPTGRQASPLSPKTLYHLLRRYLPYLIVSIIYFILRFNALEGFVPEKGHAHLSNYEYFINVFPLFTRYLEKLILPINLHFFYVFHPISSIFELIGIITIILTLVFIFLVYFFRRHKIVFLSLLWIVIPLLPVFYIPTFKGEVAFAERYLYLPSVGFVVLGGLAIERISHLKVLRQTANYVIISVLVILTGLYSVGTIKRNYVWRNDYTLWTDTVKKSPDSFMAHGSLGNAYHDQQRFEDAIKEFMIAIKLKPDYPEAYNNLGLVYYDQQRFEDAIKEYMTAIKLKPDSIEAHNNLGLVYFEQQRFEEAIKEYMIVIKLKPNSPATHYNIGNVYYKYDRFDEAIKEYMIALRLKPNYAEAHHNLGLVYLKKGLRQKAEEEFKTALKIRPDFILLRPEKSLNQ